MQVFRVCYIFWVLCRYRLDRLAPQEMLPVGARVLLKIGPWRLFPAPSPSDPTNLKDALVQLGPIFIKFGQVLSTRPDIVGEELAECLSALQDKVEPFDSKVSRALIEDGLGEPIEKVFDTFDTKPLASASVAQVHSAILQSGESVVVKVIRPGLRRKIHRDVSWLRSLAKWLERNWRDGKRLHLLDVVEDYERTILDELDLQREAANASQIYRNFEQSPLIKIPRVYWAYTNSAVMVMERVNGIAVSDAEALTKSGVDLKRLAEMGVEIFFTQVFRDSFFHADMHPGNIFVDAENPSTAHYVAVDFGIVGTLSEHDQSYLAKNLLAFFRRDYKAVAALHVESGWVPRETRIDEFESAIRTVCEPIFERPLKDISFGLFLMKLFQTARRFDMEVQPQLVLLQKTLLNVEGLGRRLYPDLDLWSTAQPFLEKWMRERVAPPRMVSELKEKFPQWIEKSTEIPDVLYQAMHVLSRAQHVATEPKHQSVAVRNDNLHEKSTFKRYSIGLICIVLGLVTIKPELTLWIADTQFQDWPRWLLALGLIGLGGFFMVNRRTKS